MPSRSAPAPIAGHAAWQSCGRSRMHSAQRPHDGAHESVTWSPTATPVTPSPSASTTPAPSWPSTAGHGVSAVPSIAFWSEWQTPLAARRTSTSPGPGGASSTSWTASVPPVRSRTAARILIRGPPRRCCSSRSSSTGMWQRIKWPASTSTKRRLLRLADRRRPCGGSGCGTRSRVGGSAALGMSPSSRIRSRPPPSTVGTAESSASVYGWCGPVEHDVGRAELLQPAEVEHRDAVGDVPHDAEVVADEDVGDAAAPPGARRAG